MKKINYEYPMSDKLKDVVYGSFLSVVDQLHGFDSTTRDISYSDKLFKLLGINWDKWLRVTITGSKGKGSTAVLLASILNANGYPVGLITSPHLRRFNEHIRIDGQCVTDDQLENAADEISGAVKAIKSEISPPHYLGPGGVILALAAKIFEKQNITAVIAEAGRGGEFDETRLLKGNVSMITPIMLKHASKIGPGLLDIALTKTFITAPGSCIISAPQLPSVQRVIENTAKKIHSPLISVNTSLKILDYKLGLDGIRCDIQLNDEIYENLNISLAGFHQIENAATAILAAKQLTILGVSCKKSNIYKALSRVRWPGRAQILGQKPWIFLDGAINKVSVKYIKELITQLPAKQITAVIAIHREKDLEGVCSEVALFADNLILTEVYESNLDWSKDILLKTASKYFQNVKYFTNTREALRYAMTHTRKDDGVLLLGHQSFVGAALQYWKIDTCKLW